MGESQGSSASDITNRLFASGVIGGNNPEQAGEGPPDSTSDLINKLFEQFGKLLSMASGMFGGGIQIHKIGAVGITKNIEFQQAGIQVGNNMMKAPIIGNLGGGASYSQLAPFANWNFNIEGIPIQEGEPISLASLGNLTPDYTPIGGGMSMGTDHSVA